MTIFQSKKYLRARQRAMAHGHPQVLGNNDSQRCLGHGTRQDVLRAVSHDGIALRHAGQDMQSDREIVMAAVSNDWRALHYAGPEMRGDSKIVMTALAQDGLALKYASEELRGDRGVVMAAVSLNGRAIYGASNECWNDPEILMKAVTQDWRIYKHAPEELKGDDRIAMAALDGSGCPPRAIGLKVRLLSGRSCFEIFAADAPMHEVLETFRRLLQTPSSEVVPEERIFDGKLVGDTAVINSLSELDPGRTHELTLVWS